ncbi:hypothetical protein FLL45_01555 [Aliikangiella marina]|uniref:Lambda phage tail tube protein N-terminal domain-containing protein n=1 Tax=Aliikangiella marina TaxID=1712262 RepID=A0A545THG7_9GAMM|nr:phage tail tube protein [Aliikangiella marina]TQV76673.1 hypothetical protein FLL45_01555 [Aliikangiella marina]
MKGIGTEFRIGDGGTPTEAFTAVAKVLEIGERTTSRDSTEDTTFDSTGGYKEFTPSGLKDAGELSLVLKYQPGDTEHEQLISLIDDDAVRNFQLHWPNPGSTPITETFAGFVTSVGTATPLDGDVTVPVTIKLSGKPQRS